MPPPFLIAGRPVGPGHPVHVIAEAGVNHDGDPARARLLVDAAAQAGADCVKFQTFKAERVAVAAAPKAAYQLETTDPGESQIAMLKRLELADEELPGLIAHGRARGVAVISTPYNEEDVDLLDRLDVAAFKLASIHLAEPHFLAYAARKGRPLIVSCGMATLAEIDRGLEAIRRAGDPPVVLLQCTTNYPSDPAEANLRTIPALATAFGVPVGYSDHTPTDSACLAAVALGAVMIEKHLTLDRTLPGPDHAASQDPQGFAGLVRGIREVEAALGDGIKRPTPSEARNKPNMRRSLVARCAIAEGQAIEPGLLTCRRPATGLAPALVDELAGFVAARPIAAGEMLAWSMLRPR